jgi:hypothetical protein
MSAKGESILLLLMPTKTREGVESRVLEELAVGRECRNIGQYSKFLSFNSEEGS